jgi:hypothetical protein
MGLGLRLDPLLPSRYRSSRIDLQSIDIRYPLSPDLICFQLMMTIRPGLRRLSPTR